MSLPLRQLRAQLHRFRTTRRAVAAVEFALTGMAFIAFLIGLLNLGLLGLTMSTMQHCVQAAARTAAVKASNNYVASLTTSTVKYTCPTASAVAGYFNNFATAPLPAGSTSASANPYIQAKWYNNSSGSSYTGMPPGVLLVLTASYRWAPLGFASFTNGITLRLTTLATVLGTNGTSITIDSSCNVNS